jgi:hypothetical protein
MEAEDELHPRPPGPEHHPPFRPCDRGPRNADLHEGATAVAFQLDWKAPLGYERNRFLSHADSVAAGDSNGDGDSLETARARQLGSPVLGDGQQDVAMVFHVGTRLPRLPGFVQASYGYKVRFEAPRDQIVTTADLGLWLRRNLMLAGRYQGEIAVGVGDDPDSRTRVGPQLVYRVDDHLDLVVASLHTAAARRALHTDEVFIGVAFRQNKLNRLQGFLGNSSNP